MIRVLFVCLGNICRSPMAEGVFKKIIADNGVADKFYVDSAGTSAYHIGELADARMRETAEKYGIVLESRARKFEVNDFEAFDYILAMDQANFEDISALEVEKGTKNTYKLIKMRDFDPLEKGANVPDPYYGGLDGFEQVYEILLRSNTQLFNHIRDNHRL